MARVPRVCGWLLDQRPRIVKRLEKRVDTEIILAGESDKLKIPDMKISVPIGIDVYRVISPYRNDIELFFSVIADDKLSTAYLTKVGVKDIHNFDKELGLSLLECSWFNENDSSYVFDRLRNLTGNAILYKKEPQRGNHPYLFYKN